MSLADEKLRFYNILVQGADGGRLKWRETQAVPRWPCVKSACLRMCVSLCRPMCALRMCCVHTHTQTHPQITCHYNPSQAASRLTAVHEYVCSCPDLSRLLELPDHLEVIRSLDHTRCPSWPDHLSREGTGGRKRRGGGAGLLAPGGQSPSSPSR